MILAEVGLSLALVALVALALASHLRSLFISSLCLD